MVKKSKSVEKESKVEQFVSPLLKLLQDPNRFQKLNDGWVRDKLLGVEWGPSSDKYLTFKDAQEYCSKLGGRPPEDYELSSLVDRTKQGPAIINKEMFPDMKSSWYWTGTTTAWREGAAWCVGFGYGSVNNFDKDYDCYVRPVRASQG